jgi:predicted phage tail protein
MALVGSSASASGTQVSEPEFSDVSSSGVFNVAGKKFTIASTIQTGFQYQFKLKAYNAVTSGPYSPESDTIIAALVPEVPLNLEKLSSSESSTSIYWDVPVSSGGAYITHYNVYSNSGSGDDFTFVGNSESLSFTHSNLSPSGITIAYKVAAVNDVGEGALTEAVGVIVAVVPAQPDAPTLQYADKTQVIIEWQAPNDGGSTITSYSVYISSDSEPTFVKKTMTGGSATSYTLGDVVTGETYYFKLQATNIVGNSL